MLVRYKRQNVTWVDLVSPTTSEVRSLMEEFNIDPDIAQELLQSSFRQKVDKRDNLVYITLHFSSLRGVGRRPEQEIDFIVAKNFIITTRYETSDPLHTFAKAFEVDSVLGNRNHTHGGHIFIEMMQNLYRALTEECELLENMLADIEDEIFNSRDRHTVASISQTARIIHDFRQSLIPHREMLTSFEPVAVRLFGPEFIHYLHNLEGHYDRIDHTLKNLRDSLTELRETNNSLLTTRQNEIMRTLTVLTFIFLPLVFISSLIGMYSQFNNAGNGEFFWIMVGIMLTVAMFSLLYFKRKGWL